MDGVRIGPRPESTTVPADHLHVGVLYRIILLEHFLQAPPVLGVAEQEERTHFGERVLVGEPEHCTQPRVRLLDSAVGISAEEADRHALKKGAIARLALCERSERLAQLFSHDVERGCELSDFDGPLHDADRVAEIAFCAKLRAMSLRSRSGRAIRPASRSAMHMERARKRATKTAVERMSAYDMLGKVGFGNYLGKEPIRAPGRHGTGQTRRSCRMPAAMKVHCPLFVEPVRDGESAGDLARGGPDDRVPALGARDSHQLASRKGAAEALTVDAATSAPDLSSMNDWLCAVARSLQEASYAGERE